MGTTSAPDTFQKVMNQLLGDLLDYVTVYIYDILIIEIEDESDESHLEKLAID